MTNGFLVIVMIVTITEIKLKSTCILETVVMTRHSFAPVSYDHNDRSAFT